MTLPFELQEFRRQLRRFVDKELIPLEPMKVLTPEVKLGLQQKAKAAGLWNLDVPEELGGQGLGLLAMSVFWREISRTTIIPARDQTVFGPHVGPILISLDGEQRKRFLDPVLAGEQHSCFAQTEPDAGSDPAAMRTRATRDGDHYILNGTKRFITGAKNADFAQVIAVTDAEKGARGGFSCFVVDMKAQGVTLGASHETMMGDCPSEIIFDAVRVPVENRVGPEGDGFRLAQLWLNQGRIRHGAHGCGVADRCLELTIDYIKQRKTFGAPLSSRQGVQWMIADAHIKLHAAELMINDAATKLDAGEDARRETYMVKVFGDEMGFEVADRCLQLNGGMGLTTELPIEKMWRDARSFMITEGPIEVLKTALANHIIRGH
jgi:acyl-CoA dehydrogenase